MPNQLFAPETNVLISFEDGNEFPTAVSDTKTAQWDSVSPIASFAPILGFKYSEATTLALTFKFSIEETNANGISQMGKVHYCRSLVVPNYDLDLYRPPYVIVSIENYLDQFQGVVKSVAVTIPEDAVWIGGEPSVVDVVMSIEECSTQMQNQVYGKDYSPPGSNSTTAPNNSATSSTPGSANTAYG